ncbi:MAG: glycosyltransferase family 4 protein [Nannocystales bacterium]
MKILYLHQYFISPSGAGGTRSYELARRLVRRGHDVTLVTSNAFMPEHANLQDRHESTIEGFKLVVLPVAYTQSMSYARRTRSFFSFAAAAARECLRHDADVVFATSTPLTVALPGLFARLKTGAPMVFEVRDLWPELPIAMGAIKNPVAKVAARTLEWVAYHGSEQVVALSPGMARGVEARGIPANRVTVIPNGCDVDVGHIPAEDLAAYRRSLLPEVRPDQPLLVYGGSMGVAHDPGWLVEVAAKMQTVDPDVRFALVGKGAIVEDLRARAEALGVLGKNLFIPGPIPKSDIPKLLRSAQMAVSTMAPLPELEDNSANKFFDALANGVPVALNYGGWQADLVRQYGAGLVLRQSKPAESAQRLAATLRDETALASMKVGAAALAREHFDRENLTSALEGVLSEAVQTHAAA